MARIGFYQFQPRFGHVGRNLKQVGTALRQVTADLVVLPELAFTGYYFRDRDELRYLAEDPRHSTTVDSLIGLCRERDLYVVAGFAERHLDRLFNSALLIGPGGLVHTYRKIHLFGTEKACFDPGDTPLQMNEIRGLRIGIMVCFDWIFPETTRILALQGADLICHPANLVLTYCQQAMTTRCIENRVFAVTANRCGTERRPHGSLTFTGQSQIVAPGGSLVYRSTLDRDDLFIADVDPGLARDKRIAEYNDIMADRHPEFYQEICACSMA